MITRTAIAMVLFGTVALAGTDDTVERTVRYGFTVENRTANLIEDASFWTYAPLAQTSNQRRTGLSVSHPHSITNDALGNSVVCVSPLRLKPYASVDIVIETRLDMCAAPAPLAIRTDDWLRPEGLVDFRAAIFSKDGPRVRGEGVDARAQYVYQWVADGIFEVQYIPRDRGATYALQTRRGDCTEFASLFTALCRRDGIPSRVMAGFVTARNRNLHPVRYHNWSEFHDGRHWRISDPLRRVFDERGEQFVAMRIAGDVENGLRGKERFRVDGEGLRVRAMTWGGG